MSETTTEHLPPGTTVYYCPLGDWTHNELPPTEREAIEAVAEPAATYLRRKYQGIEAEIEAHVATHSPIDWLTEINRLRSELETERAITRTAVAEQASSERNSLLVTSILVRKLGGAVDITDLELTTASGMLIRIPSAHGMTLRVQD